MHKVISEKSSESTMRGDTVNGSLAYCQMLRILRLTNLIVIILHGKLFFEERNFIAAIIPYENSMIHDHLFLNFSFTTEFLYLFNLT